MKCDAEAGRLSAGCELLVFMERASDGERDEKEWSAERRKNARKGRTITTSGEKTYLILS